MPNLTDKRRRLLAALLQHLDTHGQMPTAEELATATGRRNTSTIREDLGWLVVEGYIRHDPSQPGLIRIAPEGVA